MTLNLRSVDLNLLVVFEALVEERSVARAAARVGLTPSAVSHALRRLRASVGDELLVRRGSEFEPTPRAARLLATLAPALDQIAGALELPREFDPSTATNNFYLGVPDYAGEFLLPRLCKYLHEHAPNVSLSISSLDDRKSADLVAYEGVELQLSIHGESGMARPVQSRHLITDTFMVLMRREHPAAAHRLTLEGYLALDHLKVTGLGSAVDRRLAELGRVRKNMVKTPSWQNVPSIVESTDLVVLIPAHWAARQEFQERFSVQPLPLENFRMTIEAIWHPRNEHDAGHRWFRNLIGALFDQLQVPITPNQAR